jgi:hypothetical protein
MLEKKISLRRRPARSEAERTKEDQTTKVFISRFGKTVKYGAPDCLVTIEKTNANLGHSAMMFIQSLSMGIVQLCNDSETE